MQVVVGARSSKLSQVQVQEVLSEIKVFFPKISFFEKFVLTKGDKDQKTSLLLQDKTNFFTDEIDQMVLSGLCDIGVHSAKDLPLSLLSGLEVIAMTQGVCSKDCLVFREKESLGTLPYQAKIGTSSLRRINMMLQLRQDLVAVDIRGDIFQRLQLLENGQVDALIMAHAAIIRLGLKVNKILLEEETAPYQGKLAIVAKKDNLFLKNIFQKIDFRG